MIQVTKCEHFHKLFHTYESLHAHPVLNITYPITRCTQLVKENSAIFIWFYSGWFGPSTLGASSIFWDLYDMSDDSI